MLMAMLLAMLLTMFMANAHTPGMSGWCGQQAGLRTARQFSLPSLSLSCLNTCQAQPRTSPSHT